MQVLKQGTGMGDIALMPTMGISQPATIMLNDREHHDSSRPSRCDDGAARRSLDETTPAGLALAQRNEGRNERVGVSSHLHPLHVAACVAVVADSPPPSGIEHPSLLVAAAMLVPQVGGQRATRAKGAQDLDCSHPQSGPNWAHRVLGLCFPSFVVGKWWCGV